MKNTANIVLLVSLVLAASGAVDENLGAAMREIEKICAFDPGDNITCEEDEIFPTLDIAIAKYGISTNDVANCLKEIILKYKPVQTNEYLVYVRGRAICLLGNYGTTNDLQFLRSMATNRMDEAQDCAVAASLNLFRNSPELINHARDVLTNDVYYSEKLRSWITVCLYDKCNPKMTGSYIEDAGQRARIAAFFLERAACPAHNSLFVDWCAYMLNPWYRHSAQRRANLAAIRPPNLTGPPAEAFDECQRDAAQED